MNDNKLENIMEEIKAPKQEDKPFSVLEKFRQLKKEKEHIPTAEKPTQAQDVQGIPSTVFQTSGSPTPDVGRGGFRGRGFSKFGGQRKRGFDNNIGRPPKRLAAELWRGQREADVGITEFIRTGEGFDIILKHRYTDFHVNEIDLDGNVVKLTSIDVPKEAKVELSTEENPNILSPEQWKTLGEIVEKKLSTIIEKDVTEFSKDERQKVHKALKLRFGVHIYSNTTEVDGRKVLKIGYGLGQNSVRQRWPDDRPEYLHFVLYKENCETSEAIGVISRYSRIKPNKFGYAGTKDKRGITTQQMCLRRVEAGRFTSCTSLRGITVGNFCYKWNNLRLGDLRGNRFRLCLRNVKVSNAVVEEAVESLRIKGFINYFGMQRFGQSALVPTHVVGQAILQGDWKLATELILKPRPGEATFYDVKEAREVWWETRDPTEALRHLGRKEKTVEGKLLSALKKLGATAYRNAFDSLPYHTLTLYLHAYQSLVWNKVVSRRLRQFGLRVLPGDLVSTSESSHTDPLADLAQDKEESDASDDDSADGSPVRSGCKVQVRLLSAEEAESASIYDVVYPLPGDDIRLPDNEIASWYHEVLQADGHSMDCFGRVNKKFGMYGAYRKMLERVEDLNWYIQSYSDPDEDLLQSDVDIYNRKPPLVPSPDGPYKAIIVEFNLKSCSYATMAIRELAKCETSVVNQSKLTSQAREEDVASKKFKKEESERMELEEVESDKVICDTQRDFENGRTSQSNNDLIVNESNSENGVENSANLKKEHHIES